jgi:hypothetical protein
MMQQVLQTIQLPMLECAKITPNHDPPLPQIGQQPGQSGIIFHIFHTVFVKK